MDANLQFRLKRPGPARLSSWFSAAWLVAALGLLPWLGACPSGSVQIPLGDVAADGLAPDHDPPDRVGPNDFLSSDGSDGQIGDQSVADKIEPPETVALGTLGSPCAHNLECESGYCIPYDEGYICTHLCDLGCPQGWSCTAVQNTAPDFQYICRPEQSTLCLLCSADAQCGSGYCLTMADDSRGCSRGCDEQSPCPDGYVCENRSSEQDALRTSRQCVPVNGLCDCGPVQAGQQRPCPRSNAVGTCWGFESCNPAEGWGSCSALTPTDEVCNGVDDDCDGLADEDVAAPVQPCAQSNAEGRCTGTWLCRAMDGWHCNAPEPQAELCDYQDNDCDGAVDEDFQDPQSGAYVWDSDCGACGNDCSAAFAHATSDCDASGESPACAIDQCLPGFYRAGPFACVPVVSALCQPCQNEEDCRVPGDRCLLLDGLSVCGRDCSPQSLSGESCPADTVCTEQQEGPAQCQPVTGSCSCYREQDAGMTRACVRSNASGVCTGVQTCDAAAGWSACSAAQPAAEQCNGRDDDCNGQVDDGLPPPSDLCYQENEFGWCPGLWTCTLQPEGTAWACNAPTPSSELCDYADNDCDGLTDEAFKDAESGVYNRLEHCGVCGFSCMQAVPYVAEAACSVDQGVAQCQILACQPGYFKPATLDICVPFGAANDCSPCNDDQQCAALPGDCLEVGGNQFCSRRCEQLSDCPQHYDCSDGHCIPKSQSCTCMEEQAGQVRPCYSSNLYGVCNGQQACQGDDGWTACSAPQPEAETCDDGLDNDCDGDTDEAGALGCAVFLRDGDGDGFGDDTAVQCLCAPDALFDATEGGDCDDQSENIHPGAVESCNGIDDNCTAGSDEPGADGCQTFLRDADSDGYGLGTDTRCLCSAAFPYQAVLPGDCQDDDAATNPGMPEICNDRDDDCDLAVDEADATGCTLFYSDDDSDGFGLDDSARCLCTADLLHPVEMGGDCQDSEPSVSPQADERCNGFDDDCDLLVDERDALGCAWYYLDADEDGYGVAHSAQCLCLSGAGYTAPWGGDCDDTSSDWVPGAVESCQSDADCCLSTTVCRYGVCVPDPSTCLGDDECLNDTYCDGGECIPYGIGPGGQADTTCTRPTVPGQFSPTIQCQWTGPPSGDPYPNHINVIPTPTVADFNFDGDPATVHPSVVFASVSSGGCDTPNSSGNGVVRIIDGATCTQQYTLQRATGIPLAVGASAVAIGDIDRAADGRPEIVAHKENGGLVAFKFNAAQNRWDVLWTSTTKTGGVDTVPGTGWRYSGPSITEVDGDDQPEVIQGAILYDSNGRVLADNLGFKSVGAGQIPVVADVDGDSRGELVTGDGVWRFDRIAGTWVRESYFTATVSDGYVALGDFGVFPVSGLVEPLAEIVVIIGGTARIQTLAGQVIFGPYDLPFWPPAPDKGFGGPPTVGDFDGDGRAEFALAGRGSYNIFDRDCVASPLPMDCYAQGILWSLPSKDYSSSMTGSSVFDFDGDGFAEAVYADECYTRIYRGADGEVLFSQARTSGTWNENPIVADVDGDQQAEVVMGSNTNCGVTCPSVDAYFRGLRCQQDTDCPAGASCNVGFCRCTATSQCGGNGFACMAALPNTPGSGQVCRAQHPGPFSGLRIYGDAAGNWAASRTIWNQHAYFVTNVAETGAIPRAGSVAPNWQTPGLNNFRQNVQGALGPTRAPDLSIRPHILGNCDAAGLLAVPVDICNRGSIATTDTVTAAYFDGDPALGNLICLPHTEQALSPGHCETVACSWAVSPPGVPHEITVVADYAGDFRECWEGNSRAVLSDVTCVNLP